MNKFYVMSLADKTFHSNNTDELTKTIEFFRNYTKLAILALGLHRE